MKGGNHKKSPMCEKSVKLAHEVYDLLPLFPKEELYGICNQLRRAVLSIAANLVEDYARRKGKVFLKHLEIAYGKLMEVKFFLYFSCQRKFISTKQYVKCWELIDEIGAMLWKSIVKQEKKC